MFLFHIILVVCIIYLFILSVTTLSIPLYHDIFIYTLISDRNQSVSFLT